MTTYDKSPTLGLNLPKGTDTFDYDVFLRQNFNTLDSSLADIATSVKQYWVNGYSNWTPAFTAAFNYLKSVGGGTVLIPEGTYEATIDIPSYCGLKGTGRKSVIKLPANSVRGAVQLETSTTQFTHAYDFTIDGNKANQTTTNAKGFYYNGTTGAMTDPAFNVDNDARHVVKNLYIFNTKGNGFEINGRGESHYFNIEVRNSDSNGIVFNSFDNWAVDLSSGSNGQNGIVINDSNSRFTNLKSWNNGINDTDLLYGFGYVLNGCQGVLICGAESQANLNHGFSLTNIRGCSLTGVNSELNGQRDSLSIANTSGYYLKDCKMNTVVGTARNIRGQQDIQAYAVTLDGATDHNTIMITALAMTTGAVNDLNSQINNNDLAVVADKTDYTELSVRSKRYESVGIGTPPSKSTSPLWITSDGAGNQKGAFIQRSIATPATDNILQSFEGYQTGSYSTTVLKMDVKTNNSTNEVILDTYGTQLRLNETLKIDNSAWNGHHFIIGSYHLWVDAGDKLRLRKNSPGSDTDGNAINLGMSGTTANRPTTGLYVGLPYFDTTLNKPIWYKGSSVWVDSTGATV